MFSFTLGAHLILRLWKNLSIAKKLYFVVGAMAILITGELVVLRVAMHSLSAVRAFVEGEGTWSKAQKDAAFSLQRYAASRDESDYQAFLGFFSVSEGDHRARVELTQIHPDLARVRQGFLAGHIHPDDIDPVVDLLRRYYWVSYLDRAIHEWKEADLILSELKDSGETYHRLVHAPTVDRGALMLALAHIRVLNEELTRVEAAFSNALGEGSRWLEHWVISILFAAVLLVESIGLTLTFVTSRMISRGLGNLNEAAERIGSGDFSAPLEVHSRDEIGQLTASVNKMGEVLRRSYAELETRVVERTAELTAMATENARLYREATSAVQMREEFLSIASHELKTPLTSQFLRLQLLSKTAKAVPESPEILKIREYAEQALGVAKKQASLIEDLLDLSRLQIGKFRIDAEPSDLVEVVRDVLSTFATGSAQVEDRIKFTAELPRIVGKFDATRIGQVVTNLISNAIKYGGTGPIEIQAAKSEESLRLSVKDYGLGIELEQQSKIFERFERISPDPGISGLGLGLYISRQIVEAHGGTIEVRSFPGSGSEFVVKLPPEKFSDLAAAE